MIKVAKKKGFTLIELIVTIILLGIVGMIVIYNMTSVSRTSKETEYERFIAAVKSAASVYADLNPDAFNDLYVNRAFLYITAGDLISAGLLDDELTNPYTEEFIGHDELIKANLDSESGAIVFEYPVENEEDETFLVAISDYVVWGEPYDCMQGAGTYRLALSEEDGSLVMLDNPDTIEQYDFSCSMPSGFDPEKSGNYDVQYSWITSSGTRKTATRTLRVLAKVQPSFRTNYDYTPGEWYTPSYNVDTKTWTYLTYTPYIEGADQANTTFRITKQSNDPVGPRQNVTDGYISEYYTYPVDDGDKTYYLETVVQGHYREDYSYTAEGSMVIRSKLIIPPSFITGSSTTWATDREYSISDTYSPVGVVEYEYRLSNDPNGLSNDLDVEENNVFDRTVGVTMKDIEIITDSCTNDRREYKYIYFRAINEDGFVGDWTAYNNAFLTNQLDKLIQADSTNCSSCGTCCLSQGNDSCYYCDNSKYLSFGGLKFVILERDSSGGVLAAYEGVGANRVTPTSLVSDTWSIQTCDGLFSKNYSYTSPVLQVIIDEGQKFLSRLPDNYSQFIEYRTWSAGYSAYVGNISSAEFNKYGAALSDSNPYWTTTTYSSGFEIHVDTPFAHGDHTTRYNTYFYAVHNNSLSTAYAGSNAYVKPILKFKTLYVCGGDGAPGSPYIIAT